MVLSLPLPPTVDTRWIQGLYWHMPRLAWFALAPCFLLSGCFSVMTSNAPAAFDPPRASVALDVLTAPVQIPLFMVADGVSGGLKKSRDAKVEEQAKAYIAVLEKNPELILDPTAKSPWDTEVTDSPHVMSWIRGKVKSPDGFNDDMLFEIFRHDSKVRWHGEIPERASAALLDRLYVDHGDRCRRSFCMHMDTLMRAYTRSPYDANIQDVCDDFILQHPAKAKALWMLNQGSARRGAPDWWRLLDSAWERVQSGEAAAKRTGRLAIERAIKDPGLVVRKDFWAGVPDPESRAWVISWIQRDVADFRTRFTQEQIFELFRADNNLPHQVNRIPIPWHVDPARNRVLFEKIYQHNLSLVPGGGAPPLVEDCRLDQWCARAVSANAWDEKLAPVFVERFPERAGEIISRFKGVKNRPSWVLQLEQAIR